nr:unnamed protein product [Haemonchus contortus]
MRAFLDSRVPPSLGDYCINRRDSHMRNPGHPSLGWVEALMDKRTPSIKNQGVVVAWCEGIMLLGLNCAEKDRFLRPPFSQILPYNYSQHEPLRLTTISANGVHGTSSNPTIFRNPYSN